MLSRYCKTLTFLSSCLLATSSHAFDASTFDASSYECAFNLSVGEQSIRSVVLSEQVYRCFQFDSYSDLGVVNADRQLVPFTLTSPTANIEKKRYSKEFSFFQEPDPSSYRTGDQIRRIAALTGVASNRINDRQWQDTNIHYSSLILEQSEQESDQQTGELRTLKLSIDTSDTPIKATILVEVSDDLQHWKALSKPHNLYFLPGKLKDLNSGNLTLSGYLTREAKYLRLATLSNVEDFTNLVTNIRGSYHYTTRTAQSMQWQTVEPYQVEGSQGVWQFDLPNLVPVSAVRLSNADNIVYYKGTISYELHSNPRVADNRDRESGKAKLKAAIKKAAKGKSRRTVDATKWRTAATLNRYKLLLENGSVESPDIKFSSRKSRSWKILFRIPADLQSDQLPRIEVGWQASQLNFIAQGNGPFTLVAGRDHATKKVAFPAQLRNLTKSAEKVTLLATEKFDQIADEKKIVKTPADGFNWSEALLWAILLLAVGLLLFMAYRLTQNMNDEQTEGPDS